MPISLLQQIIPEKFSPDSRVWIFASSKPLGEQNVLEINEQLYNFYIQWQSHGTPVQGWAQCVYDRFIIVMADESQSGVSGCSTDGMMRLMKSFERQYNINLFERLSISFLINNKVECLPMNQIKYALQNGLLQTDSLLFNNLADTKEKLLSNWLVPLNKSWLWQHIIEKSSA